MAEMKQQARGSRRRALSEVAFASSMRRCFVDRTHALLDPRRIYERKKGQACPTFVQVRPRPLRQMFLERGAVA